jgi:chitodextrinase
MLAYLVVPAARTYAEDEPAGPVWPSDAQLVATEVTDNSVELSWPTAVSDAGIDRYEIFVDGGAEPVVVTGDTQAFIDGLLPDTTYEFSVEAVDGGDRRSEPLRITVTTQSAGTGILSAGSPGMDPGLETVIREELGGYEGDLTSADLDSIEMLYAHGRGIESLEGIELLTSLWYLDLSDNALTDEDLEALSALPNLSSLYLANNAITSLEPLGDLPSLRWLDVSGNAITDLTGIDALDGLEWLDLSGNPIDDYGVGETVQLPSLEQLYLVDTGLTDAGLQAVAEIMPNLQYLDISYNEISDLSPLSGMKYLRELYAPFNRIDDIGPLLEWVRNKESHSDYGYDVSYIYLDFNPIDTRPTSSVWATFAEVEAEAIGKGIDLYIYLPELNYEYTSETLTVWWWYPYYNEADVGSYVDVNGTTYPAEQDCWGECPFYLDLTDLEPGETYDVRVYAVYKGVEYDHGPTYTFTLPAYKANVHIPDPALKQRILDELGKNPEDPLSSDDMLELEYLSAEAETTEGCIRDLTGLEYAKLLKELDLSNQCVYDLSPLDGLMLETLILDGNALSNVDFFDEEGHYTYIVKPYNPWSSLSLADNYLDLSEGSEDSERLQQLRDLGIYIDLGEGQLEDHLHWEDANKLKIEQVISDSVTLSWDPVAGATGYVVYVNNEVAKQWDDGEQTTVTVAGLTPSAKYTFKVEAVDAEDHETVSGPHLTLVMPNAYPFQLAVKMDKDVYVPGDTVTAEVRATDLADIYAFDLTIEYDPEAYVLEEVRLHDDFAGSSASSYLHTEKGSGRVDALGTLTGAVSGPELGEDGVGLLVLTFTAQEAAVESAEVRVLADSQAMTSDLRPYRTTEDAVASAEVVIPIEELTLKTDDAMFVDGELWLDTNANSTRHTYTYSVGAGNILFSNNPTNTELIWTTSNGSVATVADGVITAVGRGTATITARAKYGEASASVTVRVDTSLESIKLNVTEGATLIIGSGKTRNVTYTLYPTDPTPDNVTVTWSSSDPSIATVENGMIRGVSQGVTYVTVTAVQTPAPGAPFLPVTKSHTVRIIVAGTVEMSITASPSLVDINTVNGDDEVVVKISKTVDDAVFNKFYFYLDYDPAALTYSGIYTELPGVQVDTYLLSRSLMIDGYSLSLQSIEGENLAYIVFKPTGWQGKTELELSSGTLLFQQEDRYYYDREDYRLISIALADMDLVKSDELHPHFAGLGIEDIVLVAQQYGAVGNDLQGDLNYDGKVDIVDIAHIVRRYMWLPKESETSK